MKNESIAQLIKLVKDEGITLLSKDSKLAMKKNRNMAVAAVARKLTVAIWHLLKGHFNPLLELSKHLTTKLLHLATLLGKENLKGAGFENRNEFIQHFFKKIQLST